MIELSLDVFLDKIKQDEVKKAFLSCYNRYQANLTSNFDTLEKVVNSEEFLRITSNKFLENYFNFPKSAEDLRNLGIYLLENNRDKKAEKFLSKSLILTEDDEFSLLGYSFALYKQGKYLELENFLVQHVHPKVSIYQNNYHFSLLSALCLYFQGKFKESLTFFQKASQIDKENLLVLKYWAIALQKSGETKESHELLNMKKNLIDKDIKEYLDLLLDHFRVWLNEDSVSLDSAFMNLNDLGWGFIFQQEFSLAYQIGQFLAGQGKKLNHEKMHCFGRDLVASSLTESENIDDLVEAIKIFQEIQQISADYYSPKIYEKAVKKIKILGHQNEEFRAYLKEKDLTLPEIDEEISEPTDFKDKRKKLEQEIDVFVEYSRDITSQFRKKYASSRNLYGLATASLQEGKIDVGKSLLERTLEEDPSHYQAMTILANILLQLEQLDRVKRLLETAIELKSDYAPAYDILSQYYEKKGHLKESYKNKKIFQHLLALRERKMNSGYERPPFDRNKLREKQKIRIDKVRTQLILAQIACNLGNYLESLAQLRYLEYTSVKNDYQTFFPQIYALKTLIYFNLKNFQKSLDYAEKTLKFNKNNSFILRLKLEILDRINNITQVQEIYENLIRTLPNEIEIWLKFVKWCLGHDKVNMAQDLLRYVQKSSQFYALADRNKEDKYQYYSLLGEIQFLLGKIELIKGNTRKALNFFQKAENSLFFKQDLYLELAQLYYDEGNLEKTLQYLIKAHRIYPNYPKFWRKLGDILDSLDLHSDSKICYCKAYLLNPVLINRQNLPNMEFILDFNLNRLPAIDESPRGNSLIFTNPLNYFEFFLKKRQYQEALVCLDKLCQSSDFSEIKLFLTVLVQLKSGNNEDISQEIWKMIQKFNSFSDSTDPDFWFHLVKKESSKQAIQNLLNKMLLMFATLKCDQRRMVEYHRKLGASQMLSWEDEFVVGIQYHIQNNFSSAKTHFTKAQKLDPNNDYISDYLDMNSFIESKLSQTLSEDDKPLQKSMKFYYDTKMDASEVDALLDLERIIKSEIKTSNPQNIFGALGLDFSFNSGCTFAHRDGHVIELGLKRCKIETLPDSIGNFLMLQKLNLESNLLQNLPNSMSRLKNLIELNLSSNQLSVFPDFIFGLKNLNHLDMKSNQFKSVPLKIRSLKKLKYLSIEYNTIQEIPRNRRDITDPGQIISMLESHQHASEQIEYQIVRKIISSSELLQKREFSNTNYPLFTLENDHIATVDFSRAEIEIFPEELCSFEHLTSLDLSSNKIVTLPPSIKKLTRLKSFILHSNSIHTLPAEMEYLQSLRYLDLYENPLPQLPSFISQLANLRILNLPEETLPSGALAQILFKSSILCPNDSKIMHQLKKDLQVDFGEEEYDENFEVKNKCISSLSFPSDTKCIPNYIESLFGLMKYSPAPNPSTSASSDVFTCFYQGVRLCPEEVVIMKKLEKIIGRPIPTYEEYGDNEFSFEFWVEDFHVTALALEGVLNKKVPDELFLLSRLKKLNLAKNHLKKLPKNFHQIKNLEWLNIGSNVLSDFPPHFENHQKLRIILFDDNQFSTIPSVISQLQALLYISFHKNPLSVDTNALLKDIYPYEDSIIPYLERDELTAYRKKVGNFSPKIIPKSPSRMAKELSGEQKTQSILNSFLIPSGKTLKQLVSEALIHSDSSENQESERILHIWINHHLFASLFMQKCSLEVILDSPIFQTVPCEDLDILITGTVIEKGDTLSSILTHLYYILFPLLASHIWGISLDETRAMGYGPLFLEFIQVNAEHLWVFKEGGIQERMIAGFVLPSIKNPFLLMQARIEKIGTPTYKIKKCTSPLLLEVFQSYTPREGFKPSSVDEIANFVESYYNRFQL